MDGRARSVGVYVLCSEMKVREYQACNTATLQTPAGTLLRRNDTRNNGLPL